MKRGSGKKESSKSSRKTILSSVLFVTIAIAVAVVVFNLVNPPNYTKPADINSNYQGSFNSEGIGAEVSPNYTVVDAYYGYNIISDMSNTPNGVTLQLNQYSSDQKAIISSYDADWVRATGSGLGGTNCFYKSPTNRQCNALSISECPNYYVQSSTGAGTCAWYSRGSNDGFCVGSQPCSYYAIHKFIFNATRTNAVNLRIQIVVKENNIQIPTQQITNVKLYLWNYNSSNWVNVNTAACINMTTCNIVYLTTNVNDFISSSNQVTASIVNQNVWNLDVYYAEAKVSSQCIPEGYVAMCLRLGKTCGSVTANDNCGILRTVPSCGTCSAGYSCNSSGKCVLNPTCTDTDSSTYPTINYTLKGTASNQTASLTDYCFSNTTLYEFYCNSSGNLRINLNSYTCPSGYNCSNGACVSAPTCIPVTCTQLNRNCGISNNGCGVNLNCGTCENGFSCVNGLCKVTNCTDTDNGVNVSIKGRIYGFDGYNYFSNWDYCALGGVADYVCYNDPSMGVWGTAFMSCPSGTTCSNGACV